MGAFGKKESIEGLIHTYDIIYLGGHPSLPKAKLGKIIFNLYKSNFELVSTIGSAKWFTGFSIPYDKVIDLQIVQRQIGSVEGVLGGLNSRQLNQPNNIHIKYLDENNNEVLIRLEMLSGITVMGQAKKCLEFEDVMRCNHIREQFKRVNNQSVVQPQNIDDFTVQIEKLALLYEKKLITEEEFQSKKTELLSRI